MAYLSESELRTIRQATERCLLFKDAAAPIGCERVEREAQEELITLLISAGIAARPTICEGFKHADPILARQTLEEAGMRMGYMPHKA